MKILESRPKRVALVLDARHNFWLDQRVRRKARALTAANYEVQAYTPTESIGDERYMDGVIARYINPPGGTNRLFRKLFLDYLLYNIPVALSMKRSKEVGFYGAEVGWIEQQAEKHGVANIVKQFGIVPREIALNSQRESQLLLFIKWNDPGERGYYSAKIFGCLAAKRPIPAIGGYEDVASELLNETEAGTNCSTVQEIEHTLTELYHEYRETGKLEYRGDNDKINKYSQQEMAQKFAEVLENIVE